MVLSELFVDGQKVIKGFETVTKGMNAGHLQIRYGEVNCPSSANTNITFGTPFDNACLMVICGSSQAGFAAYSHISGHSWTKTGFQAWQYNAANANMVISYIAIGY